ncbi:hypothetical protein PSP31121_01522 [Pandoraea sputorum]|uniref:Uncharacterized protein n=1 Tax=Pandoraea sputorum TaxID=93222 RepID=A0A5E5AWE4_9BURK|nr:hypothetical protein PSP31121_01522 [Pandoraea sputorum]
MAKLSLQQNTYIAASDFRSLMTMGIVTSSKHIGAFW